MAGETSNIAAGADVFYHYFPPAGSMMMYGGSASDPDGWLICDGRAVSRSTYSTLFTAISTTYGVGDGSTTFNLPDMRGRSPLGTNDAGLPNGVDAGLTTRNEGDEGGAETHTLTEAEMPSHTHSVAGVSYQGVGDDSYYTPENTSSGGIDVVTDSTGSSSAHNTMHPYTVVNFIIKT